MLPFRPESFDFVSCQFGFHHVSDKTGMLHEVFRVLRLGGRFVMRNLCPHEQPDWLYYEYFPEAQTIDLEATGFVALSVESEHIRFEQNLRVWLDMVRRRDLNSQLMAISDATHEAGLRRLEREVAEAAPRVRTDHLCLLTIHGDRRDDG